MTSMKWNVLHFKGRKPDEWDLSLVFLVRTVWLCGWHCCVSVGQPTLNHPSSCLELDCIGSLADVHLHSAATQHFQAITKSYQSSSLSSACVIIVRSPPPANWIVQQNYEYKQQTGEASWVRREMFHLTQPLDRTTWLPQNVPLWLWWVPDVFPTAPRCFIHFNEFK